MRKIIWILILLSLFFGCAMLFGELETEKKTYSNFSEAGASDGISSDLHPFLKNSKKIEHYYNFDESLPKQWMKLPAEDLKELKAHLLKSYPKLSLEEYKKTYGCDCPWDNCFTHLHANASNLQAAFVLSNDKMYEWIFLDEKQNEVFLCAASEFVK